MRPVLLVVCLAYAVANPSSGDHDAKEVNPPNPSPTPLVECKNNGILVRNPDGSAKCYCTGLFTGDDCGTRLCLNGGSLDADTDKCICEGGFVGEFCEKVQCSDNTDLKFDAEQPTLTLVIRTRAQLADVITQVSKAVTAVINDLAFDPSYLRRFVLVTFNNNRLTTRSYFDPAAVLLALIEAAQTTDSNGTCYDTDFTALSAALSQYITYKSPVYVITDALPNDGTQVDNVYLLLPPWRSPVYFLYLESECATKIDEPAYRLMDTVAQRSAGQIFYFTNRKNIDTFLAMHMRNILYRSQMLLSNDLPSCTEQLAYKSVSVDSSFQMLAIVATGRDVSLLLKNPEGAVINATAQYSDGLNHVWFYNGPQTGNWMFTFRSTISTQSCSYRIYQAMHAKPSRDAQMDLFWSTSLGIHFNMGAPQPLHGFSLPIVMHLTNYPSTIPPDRVEAFLTITAIRQGKPKQIYASNGIWRDVCAYNFYFRPFQCKVPGELLHFNFYAQGFEGYAVQRAGVMYCAEITPPPTSHSACQNGGVMNANATCFCPPGYTGDLCERIKCYNGGRDIGMPFCSCLPGWTGIFCERAMCDKEGESPDSLLNKVDMVFIVELTAQAHDQIVSLNMHFAEMIRDVQAQSPNWIDRFYLVGFNSTWADVIAVSPGSDPHLIISELSRLAKVTPTDSGCRVQLWQGFERLLQWNITAGSYVEVFQTSPDVNSGLSDLTHFRNILRSRFLKMNGFLLHSEMLKPHGFACNATQLDYALPFMMTTYPLKHKVT